MKNNYQEIIDKFGKGRIGDVLEEAHLRGEGKKWRLIKMENEIVELWRYVGLTKSLSEILSDEMKTTPAKRGDVDNGYGDENFHKGFVRKELSPKATELFQLLKTL